MPRICKSSSALTLLGRKSLPCSTKSEREIQMRYDHFLYAIAIICFVFAGLLLMGHVNYIQLAIGDQITNLLMIMLSAFLGLILAGIGYVTRPKRPVLIQPPSPAPSITPKSTKPNPSTATCPECNSEVAQPRKTWKMAGRPDKTGKRTEMTIGLFDCPTCGKTFRTALEKRKI